MSAEISIAEQLKLASQHAALCTATMDVAAKVGHLTQAIGLFKPLAETQPDAAFGMGLLAENMAV